MPSIPTAKQSADKKTNRGAPKAAKARVKKSPDEPKKAAPKPKAATAKKPVAKPARASKSAAKPTSAKPVAKKLPDPKAPAKAVENATKPSGKTAKAPKKARKLSIAADKPVAETPASIKGKKGEKHITHTAKHPYENLPPSSFWRTAVSERNFLGLENVYRKKYDISTDDRIVSAGSCFAQHIARKLAGSGFAYRDYEPAPPGFPASRAGDFGYGIFSARYGNIYTVRQLLQLLERAFEGRVPAEDYWESEGRVYDPFRPAIEPNGFESLEEFRASRATHLRAVRRVFTESDIFIFTLGLTEAWRSREDGSVYPLCPGTSCGTFDPARHEFHNFTSREVIEDLETVICKTRALNPGLRFLLTVSPVPLTATAMPEHVMVATTYSKSVLRAAAGEIAAADPLIDYFPSYELVTAPPSRASLFEPNFRSVTPAGVNFVMKHFFAGHGLSDPGAVIITAPRKVAPLEQHPDDLICEEAMLDQFSQ